MTRQDLKSYLDSRELFALHISGSHYYVIPEYHMELMVRCGATIKSWNEIDGPRFISTAVFEGKQYFSRGKKPLVGLHIVYRNLG